MSKNPPESTQRYRSWTWHTKRNPLTLQLRENYLPIPGAGEVLVKNRMIGLNPVDWKALGGITSPWQPGHIPGADGAGNVVALGPEVNLEWLQQPVAYHQSLLRDGSFSEYTVLEARSLLLLPDQLSFEHAAAFPCPGLTAWLAIEKLPARTNNLLIAGAGGSVGHYVTQLAKQRGWRVTAMAHERHHVRLRSLGAIHCISGPLPEGVQRLPDDVRFNAVIDCVSASHAEKLASALSANGHLVCIHGRLEQWPYPAFGSALSLHEVALNALHQHGDDADWASLTAAGKSMLEKLAVGDLQGESYVTYAFEELHHALNALKHRSFTGKMLVHF